jgi:hypothetical protein
LHGAKGCSLADYDWVDGTANGNIRRAALSPVSAWARNFPRCVFLVSIFDTIAAAGSVRDGCMRV